MEPKHANRSDRTIDLASSGTDQEAIRIDSFLLIVSLAKIGLF